MTYETAVQAVQSRLGEDAAGHSRRAGDTAATLAILYGVDPETARLGGVLHDWDREQDPRDLIAEARRVGLTVTDVDAAQPHLLHARTGAEALRATFPALPDEVLRAVSRHTIGAADMSDLDMIVYLADMIEPGREYPGVEELREVVGQVPLLELFRRAYQQSMLYLITRRRPIHPDTIDVWNGIVAGGRR